jgi:hypothetical protein
MGQPSTTGFEKPRLKNTPTFIQLLAFLAPWRFNPELWRPGLPAILIQFCAEVHQA